MPARAILLALLVLTGCGDGRSARPASMADPPPAPLDSVGVASDARLDSSGAVLGSFVGEGTSRAVHLLSSDTAFIRALLTRWQPELVRSRDAWAELARRKSMTLGHRAGTAEPLVGSPLGHTAVSLGSIVVRAGKCEGRGAQAELVVEDRRAGGGPPLRGPVLGSFVAGPAGGLSGGAAEGAGRPNPPASLVQGLIERTDRVADSMLAPSYGGGGARTDSTIRLEVNTLADVDAADVIPFRTSDSTMRYAVSLRTRRITAGGDTLMAAAVMAWDSAGSWRQVIFRPTLLSLRDGRLGPAGDSSRSVYWRRLQPISDFVFHRDNLWMEQVDVRDGTVLWGIVQPHGNVVVAAAEVDGPCR